MPVQNVGTNSSKHNNYAWIAALNICESWVKGTAAEIKPEEFEMSCYRKMPEQNGPVDL